MQGNTLRCDMASYAHLSLPIGPKASYNMPQALSGSETPGHLLLSSSSTLFTLPSGNSTVPRRTDSRGRRFAHVPGKQLKTPVPLPLVPRKLHSRSSTWPTRRHGA